MLKLHLLWGTLQLHHYDHLESFSFVLHHASLLDLKAFGTDVKFSSLFIWLQSMLRTYSMMRNSLLWLQAVFSTSIDNKRFGVFFWRHSFSRTPYQTMNSSCLCWKKASSSMMLLPMHLQKKRHLGLPVDNLHPTSLLPLFPSKVPLFTAQLECTAFHHS